MRTRKIFEDRHGLYVKENGAIFRPEVNDFYRPLLDYTIIALSTRFRKGDVVRVHGIYDMLYIYVGPEIWYSHGSYVVHKDYKTITLKSEELWQGGLQNRYDSV